MAYVVSEVEFIDDESAARYRELAARSIEVHGGHYLVRGAGIDVVEGRATQRRLVICEFPSMEHVRRWYVSPAYARALAFRGKGLRRRLIFVEGVV